jgi:hypothetical protein
VRRQQFTHLDELAGIVGRDHELAGEEAMLSHEHLFSVMAGHSRPKDGVASARLSRPSTSYP